MARKLYVGNLSFDVTSEALGELFKQVGTCESARVITDRATGRSRGFGFVEMGSDADAQRAVQELDGKEFQGRTIRVNEAREQESRGGGGGGGGRRGGGGDRGGWHRH
jgi:RNA recognition motif-containing protein